MQTYGNVLLPSPSMDTLPSSLPLHSQDVCTGVLIDTCLIFYVFPGDLAGDGQPMIHLLGWLFPTTLAGK